MDADEDKPITLANPPPSGEVNFYAKMNGTAGWTDMIAAGTWLRAVHLNELRWACETLSRGRWKMPIYFSAEFIPTRCPPRGEVEAFKLNKSCREKLRWWTVRAWIYISLVFPRWGA